jgi:hypothetical protein
VGQCTHEAPIGIFFVKIRDDADPEIGRMLAEATGGAYQIIQPGDLVK